MSLKKTNNITYPPYLLGNFVSCHNKKMTQMQLYALFYETSSINFALIIISLT